jgi:hypothetical protein
MRKCLALLVVILFVVNINGVCAQSKLLWDSIRAQQAGAGDSFYQEGLFRSQIAKRNGRKTVEDNNIFFTALINYTLQSCKDSLSADEQLVVDSLYAKSKRVLPYYQNRKGDITYNFYQVNPENPFPNLRFYSGIRKFRLTDDLDDTSLIYLILQSSDSLNKALKKKMAEQSRNPRKIVSTLPKYRESKAYRTWFADKMKQDLDICVMANVLTFVFQKKLPMDSVDIETIQLISQLVSANAHLTKARWVSAHYQSSSIILYHLARLIVVADHPDLNPLKRKIVSDLHNQLRQASNPMERVILLTSLYRLGEKVNFEFDLGELEGEMKKFFWFNGNPFSGSPVWVKKLMGKKFMQLRYTSSGYYWCLLLELKTVSKASVEVKDGRPTIHID